MKVLITGNKNFGIAKELFQLYPDATFVSKTTGVDLTTQTGHTHCAELCLEHDIFINCAALWKFNQTVLLETVYKACVSAQHDIHIINIGSTTDRVKNGKPWLYNAEKKALRDYSNTLGIAGVWDKGPKVSYISFGTLSNNQEKHPDRRTMNINLAAQYIKWIIDQPKEININELSVDPLQNERWYKNES
jgi:NADP-dependent 3-hydroxy acid dehydrogenase YdfG